MSPLSALALACLLSTSSTGAVHIELENFQVLQAESMTLLRTPGPVEDPAAGGFLQIESRKTESRHVESRETTLPPFSRVRHIHYQPVIPQFNFVSSPSVQCLSLGGPAEPKPEPPDWFAPNVSTGSWVPVSLPSPRFDWFYLPGAAWVWSPPGMGSPTGEAVLFRESFEIPALGRIASGRLALTADSVLSSVYVNGIQLPFNPQAMKGRKVVFEAGPLLRPGPNLIAIRAAGQQKRGVLEAGMAFRLDFTMAAPTAAPPPGPSIGRAVFYMTNGDIVSGDLAAFSPGRIQLQAPYGSLALELSRVAAAWIEPGVSGTPAYSLDAPPKSRAAGLEKADGTLVVGAISAMDNAKATLTSSNGKTVTIALDGPVWLYPNPYDPQKVGTDNPPVPAISYGRIRLTNGDRLSGALKSLDDNGPVLALSYVASPLRVAPDGIVDLRFPGHASLRAALRVSSADRPGSPALPACVIMGESSPGAGKGESDCAARVIRALDSLGVAHRRLSPGSIADLESLNPNEDPVLIDIDEREQYLHTAKDPGDGHAALISYVRGGGSFVHLAGGEPFAYASIKRNGRWLRVLDDGPDGLNALLGFGFAIPGVSSGNVIGIETPPNSNRQYTFVRGEPSGDSDWLPPQIDFPATADTRFYPFVPAASADVVDYDHIYNMMDEGFSYGPAMTVARYRGAAHPGNLGIYIARALSNATYDGEPVLKDLLAYSLCRIARSRHESANPAAAK